MTDNQHELRWLQRFRNFERAFLLLQQSVANGLDDMSDLEKEGVIQRFEYTFELAWKTLRDYMEYQGHAFEQPSPRQVLKMAFSVNYISAGEVWMEMLEQRNLLAHTYDEENFEKAIELISRKYFSAIDGLFGFLKEKSSEK